VFRQYVAVAFMTLALAGTGAFGYITIKDLNDHGNQVAQVVGPGGTEVTTGAAGASPSAGAVNPLGGSSSTAVSSLTGGSTAGAPKSVANTQAASGVTGDKIITGGFFDMTGPVDSSVERDTVKSYFALINAQGGINGRKLVFIDCDSKYDAVQTHNCANEMVAAHVLATVGVTAPKGENEQVSFLTQQEGIPWVGGLGTPEEYKYPLAYPVSPSFAFSGNALAGEFQLSQKSSPYYRHPAILYIADVPWVQPVLDAIVAALKKIGVTPTTIEAANATDGDYTGHVANLKLKNDKGPCASPPEEAGSCPDSLIAATDPFSYARLFQAMDRVGWHPPLVAGGLDKGNQQSAYGDQLGCPSCGTGGQPRYAQSLVPFASPLDPANSSNPTVQSYLNAVQRYYPSQVPALDIYTQIAWSAAQVFVEAAKRAGSNLTRVSLVNALNSIKNFNTGWSTPLSYSAGASHDPNHCYYFMKHDPKTFDDGGTWRQYTGLNCY